MSRFHPDVIPFRELAQGRTHVPVYRQLVSDSLTPVSAYGCLQPAECSFLFESVIGGERIGRYSFLGADPRWILEAYDKSVVVREGDRVERHTVDDPLLFLQQRLADHTAPQLPGLPRFLGGVVGYAGYDTVRYTENLPHPPPDDRHVPDMVFALYDRMIVFDHIRKIILVVVQAAVQERGVEQGYQEACQKIDALCDQLSQRATMLPLSDIRLDGDPPVKYQSNFTRAEFENAVRKCQEYIVAGDIFQVVISQRLTVPTTAQPLDIYRALRVVNPSPFMFLLETPGVSLVGSSPEIMVRVEDGETTIRPLAGTRRRGKTDEEDRALERELLADEKERAEHIMLVDLARNDVGRVAEYGSIHLSDVMKVERYSHVMHITSNVTGQLSPGKSALDALRAGLPAGTVSGAPKVRAMEIIDEIEPHRRGPYAGAVGYLDFTGNMDTCIALRTLVMTDKAAYVQAGCGVVADSDPASEYEETLSKARGLLKAIDVAERQLKS